jgi:hypothetical protein
MVRKWLLNKGGIIPRLGDKWFFGNIKNLLHSKNQSLIYFGAKIK